MLEVRSEELEIMDDLNISGDVIASTLKELDTINQLLGGNSISLSAFRKFLKFDPKSVADLGCGSGDLLIKMALMAKGKEIQFTGIDANPHIVDYARQHTEPYQNISIQCIDIFSEDFNKQSFDIVHCCLFLHHFTNQQLIGLFKSMNSKTRYGIIVNDLQRNMVAYYSIKWLTYFFSKSYMVKNDAAVSVARGFSKKELTHILDQAGIVNYTLHWKWAFRWQLIIYTKTL